MIEIIDGRPDVLIPIVIDLCKASFDEVDAGYPFNIDVASYKIAHDAGQHRMFVAREGADYVGLISFFVTPEYFNPSIVNAYLDCVYVLPSKRGGTLFNRLVKVAKGAARDMGAMNFTYVLPAKFADVFTKRGHVLDEVTFKEEL